MKKHLSILAIAFALASSTLVNASILSQLQGSAWSGAFTTPLGVKSPIRLIFLPELNLKNDLQYYHRLMGTVTAELLAPDQACAFTPRTIKMQQSISGASGQISIFKCAADAQEEAERSADPNRSPLAQVDVLEISISQDGRSLTIVAKASGVELTYRLTRQDLAHIKPSTEELKDWINN